MRHLFPSLFIIIIFSAVLLNLCTQKSFIVFAAANPQPSGQSSSNPDASTSDVIDGAATKEVSKELLDKLNPLKQYSDAADQLDTPGKIATRFLQGYAMPMAGLILFVMLLWGGFEMLLGAADKKSIDAGKQRITAALIGFGLLFTAFWIARIIEIIFGIQIL